MRCTRLGGVSATWKAAALPTSLRYVADAVACPQCGSGLVRLLAPYANTSDWENYAPDYFCAGCGHQEDALELLEETLLELEGGFNPFDGGDEPPTTECLTCGRNTYVHSKGECVWCEYEPTHKACPVCGNGLSLDEQELGRLCSYHHNAALKDD